MHPRSILAAIPALALMVACTTTDPYTGETRIDAEATTGLVLGAAAIAATAYAVSQADDDDDYQYDYRHNNHRGYNGYGNYNSRSNIFHPRNDVTCYNATRRCYSDGGHYSSRWTRRSFN